MQAATFWADPGVPVTLVSDALGPSLMEEASCALVGADAVLRDAAVVNKIGTYALALAASDRKKPFYVACETLKFDARYDSASWPKPAARTQPATASVASGRCCSSS